MKRRKKNKEKKRGKKKKKPGKIGKTPRRDKSGGSPYWRISWSLWNFKSRIWRAQAGGEGVTMTLSPSRNPREFSFSSGTFPPVGGDHPGYKTLRDFPGLGSGHLDLKLGWVGKIIRIFFLWGIFYFYFYFFIPLWDLGFGNIRGISAPKGVFWLNLVFFYPEGWWQFPKFQCRDGKAPGLKNISGRKSPNQ